MVEVQLSIYQFLEYSFTRLSIDQFAYQLNNSSVLSNFLVFAQLNVVLPNQLVLSEEENRQLKYCLPMVKYIEKGKKHSYARPTNNQAEIHNRLKRKLAELFVQSEVDPQQWPPVLHPLIPLLESEPLRKPSGTQNPPHESEPLI